MNRCRLAIRIKMGPKYIFSSWISMVYNMWLFLSSDQAYVFHHSLMPRQLYSYEGPWLGRQVLPGQQRGKTSSFLLRAEGTPPLRPPGPPLADTSRTLGLERQPRSSQGRALSARGQCRPSCHRPLLVTARTAALRLLSGPGLGLRLPHDAGSAGAGSRALLAPRPGARGGLAWAAHLGKWLLMAVDNRAIRHRPSWHRQMLMHWTSSLAQQSHSYILKLHGERMKSLFPFSTRVSSLKLWFKNLQYLTPKSPRIPVSVQF